MLRLVVGPSVRGCANLIGAGGCGETRLALGVASQVAALYEDGAWWVDLASVTEPTSLAAVVGRALGLWLEGEADPAAALAQSIRERRILLAIDNCEHQLGACRSLAARLVECPGLHLLATSREAIGAPSEVARRIPSLELPSSEGEVARSEAGRLFLERARAVRPNFTVSGGNAADGLEICRGLDGIPLAIELAAARRRLLTPRQIATGLEEDSYCWERRRHRVAPPADAGGLGSVKPWAVRRPRAHPPPAAGRLRRWLHPRGRPDRLRWRAPGLARGSRCTGPADRPLDGRAGRLRRRSPLPPAGDRESLRPPAPRRVREHDSLRDRHLEYFRGLAEAAQAALPRSGGLGWLPPRGSLWNLLASLHWDLARRQAEPMLRLATALALFWELLGRFGDGASWLD